MRRFVERGTDYLLEHGKLSVYETNCSCKDVKFYFKQHTLTLMVAGHKSIATSNLKLEFFPGTFYIPEKDAVHHVDIPNASFDHPTKCLVLEVDPTFLHDFYQNLSVHEGQAQVYHARPEQLEHDYFFSNDHGIIDNFVRLYEHQLKEQDRPSELIGTLILKELLLRVFQTPGLHLLKRNFESKVDAKEIRRSIDYIRKHLSDKISVEQLAGISQLGITTFYKKFKAETGYSPADYILRERIGHSKIMIQKGDIILKEVAFRSGFNSYEYFCNSFKKIEKIRPVEYRRLYA